MARADSRIPLMYQGPQIEPFQNALARSLQARALQGRVAAQEQQISDTNALRKAAMGGKLFTPDGMLAPNALDVVGRMAPGSLPQFAQLAATQQQTQRKNRIQDAEFNMKRQEWLKTGLSSVKSPQEALAYIQSGVQSGLVDPTEAQQWSAQVPQDPGQFNTWITGLNRQLMTPAQRTDQTLRQQQIDLQRERLNATREQPKGQVTTLADGTVGLIDPYTGSFTPSTGPDGKPVRGKVPGRLSGKQLQNAQDKLRTVAVLRQQLQNLKTARDNLGMTDFGLLNAGALTEAGRAYDMALAAIQPTIRQLTRTPGEGSTSDYEARLQQAQIPDRQNYGDVIDQGIKQIEDLANTIYNGYTDMVGDQAPQPTENVNTAPSQAAAPDRAALEAEARRRGLIK